MTTDRYLVSPQRGDRSRAGVHGRASSRRSVAVVSRPSRQFWALAVLLGLTLFLGGSSRADVATVQFLRPLSVFFLAYGLFCLPWRKVRQHRWLFGLTASVVALHVVHLVPMPGSMWSSLPGREIVVRVDHFLGVTTWRPLSMDPEGGWNALYALALPVAALALGVQLGKPDQVRLVILIACFIAISGFLGVLQSAGGDLHPYPRSVGATGLFANRNHQAALLAVFLPLVAVATSTSNVIWPRVRHAKVIGWVLGAIAMPLILVTGSRAGLLLAIVGAASILIARLYRGALFPKATGRFSRLRSPWLLGGGVLLAGSLLAWLTIVQARGVAIDRLQGGNFELRWPIWRGAWELTGKFWPIGSGLGSYERVYQIYEPAELLRPTYSNHVHNDWLEVLMTAGMPGLLLLGLAIVMFGLAFRRSGSGTDTEALLRRLGLVTTFLLALASVVDYPVRVPFVACVFALGWVWSFVGLDEHAN